MKPGASAGLAAMVMAAVIGLSATGPPSPLGYFDASGSPPSTSIRLPGLAIGDSFVQRVLTGGIGGNSPSEPDYQNFSASYWGAGYHVQGTFWVPIVWLEYLNLTGNSVQADASGRYLQIPYEAYLGVHNQTLWIYAVVHGLTWGPYNSVAYWPSNHESPYFFGLLVRQEQYQIRWYVYAQRLASTIMGYNVSDPDAYSVPMDSSSSGLTPVLVDGQSVYVHGTISMGASQIQDNGGQQDAPPAIDASKGMDNAAILTDRTVFVLGIPFSELPHTTEDVIFSAMFTLSIQPPPDLPGTWTYFPNDYDPPAGPTSNTSWNDTSAYLPFFAPFTGAQSSPPASDSAWVAVALLGIPVVAIIVVIALRHRRGAEGQRALRPIAPQERLRRPARNRRKR